MDGSRARRRRRLRRPELQPSPELQDTSSTDTSWATTSALRPQQPWGRSKKRRKGRSRAGKDRSDEEKRDWVDEWLRGGDDNVAEEEEEMKDDDVAEEEDDEVVVSSAPSSPLRAPVESDKYRYHRDPAYDEAFAVVQAKYKEKIARQKNLPTLDDYKPYKRGVRDRPKPLPIRESERRAVLRAAKFVVGLSSSVGGEPLEQGSGFWIDWDEDNKTGIILTSEDLLFRYDRSCLKKEYAHGTQVIVHLRDDTTAEAHLLYHQQHYNLALLRVTVDQPVHLPSFNDQVQCDHEIFWLGRDGHSYLRIGRGRVEYPDLTYYHEYHKMYIIGGHEDFEYSKGGPAIDFDGNVVGMITGRGSFMISSILLKCLHIWRKFRYIPRPHLGLHLCPIRVLDLAIAEKISVKCNVDDSLIVKEVTKGSHAEKLGIRVGDVIECFNGERICNIFEFENMLLRTCEGHLEKGNGHNSKVDIVINVFHPRKGLRSNKTLVVDLSEQKESIQRVYYPFTIGEGVCASDSLDESSSD